jgi:ribosomal protein L11 methyltransferase
MKISYVEAIFKVPEEEQETAIALLDELGFEGFVQESQRLIAYIPSQDFKLEDMGLWKERLEEQKLIAWQNWNALWEKSYEPVSINTFCHIYPDFLSPLPGYKYYIRIQPKMAFGTGHHATTRLVIELMQNLSLSSAKVMDMGCGTGILGILAAKMGAASVDFADIDTIALENTLDNLAGNSITNGSIWQAPLGRWPQESYDIILANIERNALIEEAPVYVQHLAIGGLLILSGFYVSDFQKIKQTYEKLGMKILQNYEEQGWSAILLRRI